MKTKLLKKLRKLYKIKTVKVNDKTLYIIPNTKKLFTPPKSSYDLGAIKEIQRNYILKSIRK